MSNGTTVKKRNGRGVEPLNLEKIHVMVEEATKGLAGVSASQVEIQSGIQFYDGITTGEIQEILIKSASDLIDLDHPNYQFVAARLLLFAIRKQIYGKIRELPHLETHIMNCLVEMSMIKTSSLSIQRRKLKRLMDILIMIEIICLHMLVYGR